MTPMKTLGDLQVADSLHDFLVDEALPGTSVSADALFSALSTIISELGPRNARCLARRDELQARIDAWHSDHPAPIDAAAYHAFLGTIGYLVDPPGDMHVQVDRVDPEIASQAGPQLVVPVNNARYALNAANARWGSLYDALYGTDVIAEDEGAERGDTFNPVRGARVVAWANVFLDDAVPLAQGSWADATSLTVADRSLRATLESGSQIGLADPARFRGHVGEPTAPSAVLLMNNALHIDIRIDREHPIGKTSKSGVKDVILESALSTIQDCEDSVAAVDAADKTLVYRNWLGLMRGDLQDAFDKQGESVVRALQPDREYTGSDGEPLVLPGRSLLLVRNVGAHMLTDMVLDGAGEPVPETFVDALVTALCALHDLNKPEGELRNSRAGSVYIVKPKQHGPEEVALSVALFDHVERALGMPPNTLKIGIMDEERRTSVNLKACLAVARHRVIFINTGFLDRTGDEIHTSMLAGMIVPKDEMKSTAWLQAYEDNNVDVGLACGLQGQAQIGKGMWAMPDRMAEMVKTKRTHPEAGASTAWVPSPTAATLHATHYHQIDVAQRQAEITTREPASLDALLALPLMQHGRNYGVERHPATGRQQCPEHSRLRGALDQPGHRLLEGPRHPRCGIDGRSRDAAHLESVSCQLAAPRAAQRGTGSRHVRTHGPGRRPAECR